jgi:hypothetical protein
VVTCRSCAAPITWAVTPGGKAIPLDAEPTAEGNVRVVIEQPHGTVRAYVLGPLDVLLLDPPEQAALRMPHHATCPDADAWRARQ